jgi:hypothetical protein
MILQPKHKVLLWVPALLYAVLMLGDVQRNIYGELVYRVYLRGAVSSGLIILAAGFISEGSRGSFIAGIICWVLGLAALLLANRTLLVLHF